MNAISSSLIKPVTDGLLQKNEFQAGGGQMGVTNPEDLFLRQRQVNSAVGQLQDLGSAYSNAQGISKGMDVYGQQSALAQQLSQQAMGVGPNPVQAQLAQNTAANTANQAALMAGQRGVGQNAGMVARQAAMQGGANQQQMVGQAATLQAQQQLAAQQALMQQQQAMGQMAGQFMNNELSTRNSQANAALNAQSNLLNAAVGQNSNQTRVDAINSDVAGGNARAQNQLVGQMFNAGSAAVTGGGGTKMAQGGMVKRPHEQAGFASDIMHGLAMRAGGMVPGKAQVKGDSPKNDTVPAMLSPGEIVIPRTALQGPDAPQKAAAFVAAVLAKNGKAS
jgi:hypothetical protein